MKKILLVLIIFTSIIGQAQSLKQGDNLKTEVEKIEKPYYFSAPSFNGWVEGANMIMISSKPDFADADFVVLALSDTTLIGAFSTTKPYYFLIDTEGNSILDSKPDIFLLPARIVKKKTKISSTDKKIISLLDKLHEKTLQADDFELDEETQREYISYLTDTTLCNRHIALMYDNYQAIIAEASAREENPPAEICIPLITSLSNECLSVFNSIPVMVSILIGEAFQDAGMIDEAREQFKKALVEYPNSIVLLAYKYRYEEDEVKKANQLADLKENYPNHWLVKDL